MYRQTHDDCEGCDSRYPCPDHAPDAYAAHEAAEKAKDAQRPAPRIDTDDDLPTYVDRDGNTQVMAWPARSSPRSTCIREPVPDVVLTNSPASPCIVSHVGLMWSRSLGGIRPRWSDVVLSMRVASV